MYREHMSDPQEPKPADPQRPKPAPKDDKKKNTYFAGDGQSVEAPPSVDATVEELFRRAREHGATPPDEFVSHRNAAFSGTGRRLGYNEQPSLPVQPLTKDEKNVKITFFANGFTVDDGPLRSTQDDEGRHFLETVNRGFVPREIAELYPRANINVALVDRSGENHVPQFKPFEGGGHRLSSAPNPASVTPSPSSAAAPAAAVTKTVFEFRETEPAATVVLNLIDGTRIQVKVNPQRHTVSDLRGVASSATRLTGPFELVVRDIRPRPLTDPTQTLEAARCVNCHVLVKAA